MSSAPTVTSSPFGTLPDGQEVQLFTLKNNAGLQVQITNYGGIITSIKTPDALGDSADIVLGFDKLEPYLKGTPYFGALIGRYGNRIGKAKFTLDGVEYQLPINDGENHLHGGEVGFDKRLWSAETFTTDSSAGVILQLTSADGDQGYPGNLQVKVVYALTDENALTITFEAETDKATPVNLTNHAYFNLAGQGDVLGYQVMLNADAIVAISESLIPTGELMPVAGSPFDFRTPKAIGEDIGQDHPQLARGIGYDHTFVLDPLDKGEMKLAARVVDPTSGRVLEVHTEEPGVQFYSGNFLDGSLSGKGRTYDYRTGFCLEPQHFPDSPNQPAFPATILRPGETYSTRMSYTFSVQS